MPRNKQWPPPDWTADDEARALRAVSCLWTALNDLQKRNNPVAWRDLGGFDAQDLLRSLETGGQHPQLRKWKGLLAGPARNRPAPGPSEQAARRFIVLLRIALERAGVGIEAARKHIKSALRRHARQIGLQPPTSDGTIRRWERNLKPPLGPQDEAVIKQALDRCGNDHAQLTRHFLGLVEFTRKPLPTGARWR
jgi:hypothetical protein